MQLYLTVILLHVFFYQRRPRHFIAWRWKGLGLRLTSALMLALEPKLEYSSVLVNCIHSWQYFALHFPRYFFQFSNLVSSPGIPKCSCIQILDSPMLCLPVLLSWLNKTGYMFPPAKCKIKWHLLHKMKL